MLATASLKDVVEFPGGTFRTDHKAAVDASGEVLVDLAAERAAALAKG